MGQQEEVNLAQELLTSGAERRSGHEGFLGQGRDLQASAVVVSVGDFITEKSTDTRGVMVRLNVLNCGSAHLVQSTSAPFQYIFMSTNAIIQAVTQVTESLSVSL